MSRKHGPRRRSLTRTQSIPIPKFIGARKVMLEAHLRDHPGCTYGLQPHFVPPCFGDVGFFMCDPPADIRNHTRCRPPFNHEHEDHKPAWMFEAAP
jgi:hypothetical protein